MKPEDRILDFKDFTNALQQHISDTIPNTNFLIDKRDMMINTSEGKSAVMSLDKAYRFYIDSALMNPEATPSDLMIGVQFFVEQYREKTGREVIFRVERPDSISVPVVIEQCCIR
ncbi:hypothetical protein [Bacillus sp. IBL03825]|uniref:hypothetical protein n=1 Tax=Bacillus sp. IBL03825 TaxID=2953580 RepID=UPI00215728BD|nr:hypothetical protein [Bacillus sp. IBL03825]MCR6850387.1 hypothetical protein [Bacillus sp. IBL03825]